ncbi:MAG: hypothetical protein NDI62_01795 [Burkholderiales bacterium]|nr:hypothetical protein [Burkholderiales bacterium]
MSKIKILLGLSFWVTILPYLGFPITLKNLLISLSGLGLILITYLIYKKEKGSKKEGNKFDNFSENHNFIEREIPKEENINQAEF